MKVWITKYALSSGIICVDDAEICGNANSMLIYAGTYFHGEGREWHCTEDGAVKKAEKMRSEKIDSLNRSITKLKKLTFIVKDQS